MATLSKLQISVVNNVYKIVVKKEKNVFRGGNFIRRIVHQGMVSSYKEFGSLHKNSFI